MSADKRIHISQPRYLPSLNYFQRMIMVDRFVYLDTVQYTERDWENRNKVNTQHGPHWLSVPVKKESGEQLILETRIAEHDRWRKKHLKTIKMNYAGTPCFDEIYPMLEEMYEKEWERLMDLNIYFVDRVCDYLGIDCTFLLASDLEAGGEGEELLMNICRELDAGAYLSGPLGRDYMHPERWRAEGIEVAFHDYEYPEYEQGEGEFVPWLSIVDLLMYHGRESRSILDV